MGENKLPDTGSYQKLYNLRLMQWIILGLIKWQVEPNIISVVGLVFAAGVAICLITKCWLIALILLVLCGLCDFVDGPVAQALAGTRKGNRESAGRLLDWYIDRLSDFALLLGVMVYAVKNTYGATMTIMTISIVMIATVAFCHLMSSALRLKVQELGKVVEKSRPITRTAFFCGFAGFFSIQTLIWLIRLLVQTVTDQWPTLDILGQPIDVFVFYAFISAMFIWTARVLIKRSVIAFGSED